MLENIVIRNADYSDYQSLCDIFAQANAEHCQMRPDLYRKVDISIPRSKFCLAVLARNVFGYQPVSLQVAEHKGRNVGAVFVQSLPRNPLSWSVFEKEAYLDNVVTIPGYRKQGIGTLLLKAAQEWAKDTGHTHMWGKILDQNEASLTLFKNAGFSSDSTNVGRHLA